MIATRLTKLLGIQHPIIQAPMVGVDTPELAAAISNAGGLGSIAVGALTAEDTRARIRALRALTNRSFNVNVFVHETPRRDTDRERAWLEILAPYFGELGAEVPARLIEPYLSFNDDDAKLAVLLHESPSVISFHFGLPTPERAAALRNAGTKLIACATTVAEAREAATAGMDAIIAQGFEAGGHRGSFHKPVNQDQISTLALVPQVADAVDCPVIAAGGIGDGRAVAAALTLGASGAQLGTAFITCPESAASVEYREILCSDRAARTEVTTVLTGRPARGISNRFMLELGFRSTEVPDYPIAYQAGKLLAAAGAKAGNPEFGFFWSGQAAPLNHRMAAGQLLRSLVENMERVR